MLSRYEVARLVGMRALQLGDGATPLVHVEDEILRCDMVYVAAREVHAGVLDAQVRRADGSVVDVRSARMPSTLAVMLDTRDGGTTLSFRRP